MPELLFTGHLKTGEANFEVLISIWKESFCAHVLFIVLVGGRTRWHCCSRVWSAFNVTGVFSITSKL